MVSDLVYKLNDKTFLNIELNTSKSKYLLYKNLLYIYKILLNNQNKGKKYKEITVIQVKFDLYSFNLPQINYKINQYPNLHFLQ